jgi:hypothetical protein
MSDPSLELQAALISALKNNIGAAVGARVYDQVPGPVAPATTAQFPYVTLGDCQVLPDKADCIDGVEVYPQIDVWSRAVGYPETKTITKAVLARLDDQAIVVSGFHVVVFQFQSVHHLRDPDGLTHHTAITFRGLLTPA